MPIGRRAYPVGRASDLVLVAVLAIGGVRGAHYVLRGFGPGAYQDDIQSLPKPKRQWTDENDAPEEVAELIAGCGL